MTSAVMETWVRSTVLIENQWGHVGTGFLVSRKVDEQSGIIALVTNKHVLHRDRSQRQAAKWVVLNLNKRQSSKRIVKESVKYPVVVPGTGPVWREHEDLDVDVLAINVSSLFASRDDISAKWADYSTFAFDEQLAANSIGAGDEVLVVGYPLGLRHSRSNHPLVRQGMISTRIGEPLEDKVRDLEGGLRKRTIRGFLIDGAAVPGSSGSPVILKPSVGRHTGDGMYSLTPAPQFLLGILAETKYAPIETPEGLRHGFAGLGLAFDAQTVKETVELLIGK